MSNERYSKEELAYFDKRLNEDVAFRVLYDKLYDMTKRTWPEEEGDYKKLADQVNALEDKVYDLKSEVSRQYNTQEEKDRTLRDLIATNQMKIDALETLYKEQQRQIRDLVIYMTGVFTAMGHDSVTIALKGLVPKIKE